MAQQLGIDVGKATPEGGTASPVGGPFLKWAGGKKALVPKILEFVRARRFRRYFEPFVGGGAVFFALRPKRAVLSDSNPELINAYLQVQENVNSLIESLRNYQDQHSPEFYKKVRGERPKDVVDRAAWFIYLNRTCFNGLWRVNSKGQFNVPMGSYKHPRILDPERLIAASGFLQGASIHCEKFQTVLTNPKMKPRSGDAVYLDPPYDPLSATSSFTSYTKESFGRQDQERLARLATSLAKGGVRVVVSNSETEFIRNLYPNPPFITEVVQMARAISCVGSGRGRIPELLIRAGKGERL